MYIIHVPGQGAQSGPGKDRMARWCLTRRVMMIGVLVGMLQVKQLHL